MAENSKDVTWRNLGACWKPTEKKSYALSVSLDAGALLEAAHMAIAAGEVRVRAFIFKNEEKKDRAPDYRISVAYEKPEAGGNGGDAGEYGPSDDSFN